MTCTSSIVLFSSHWMVVSGKGGGWGKGGLGGIVRLNPHATELFDRAGYTLLGHAG